MSAPVETNGKSAAQQIAEIASGNLREAKRERGQLLERLRHVTKVIVDLEGHILAGGGKVDE